MKPIHYAALLLLGSIWGASFLFIGLAVHEFGPLLLMFLRVLGAGLVLVGLAQWRQRQQKSETGLNWRTNWRTYLVVGLLNSALPFTLIAFSELSITASLAAVLNSTTPLFAVLIAAVWRNEPLTRRKLLGGFLGVVGVSILTGGGPLAVNAELIVAVLASLAAALCYGAGTVYAAKNLKGLTPIYASIAQLLSAAVLLAIPAVLAIPTTMPSPTAIIALLALTLLSTSFAYLLYFFLLQNVGSTRTASVTFLVPVFGTIWGIAFLQDPFNLGMLLGMGVILASVGLVTGGQPRP
ncbi:MAG: EamA family transporter [Chloroflexi bacterium]|nr:EamA family transporter [Chloroflexota bacterium]